MKRMLLDWLSSVMMRTDGKSLNMDCTAVMVLQSAR